MKREQAVDLAQDALIWLAADPDRFGPFLGLTGLAPGDLRAAARDPEFLGAVLDHLLSDDRMVRDFAEAQGISPLLPASARTALPGGDAPSWT